MKINVGLAQIDTTLGGVEANLEKHLALIDQAREHDTDLLIFPELSLTGYFVQDLQQVVAARPTPENEMFAPLFEASHDMDLVVGFVEEDVRHRFYIAAAYLSGGEVKHTHRKFYLATYGMFDDARYFGAGRKINAFDTRFGRVGMLICEDFWHASLPYLLWVDGADIIICTSASPGRGISAGDRLGTAQWVEDIQRAYSGVFTNFFLHTNRVGIEDGRIYWGGSTAFGPDGQLLAHGPYFEEELVIATLDTREQRYTRGSLPLLRDERPALIRDNLDRILKESDRD